MPAKGDFYIGKLLFPVVPDVLYIVILFHDVDELGYLFEQENVKKPGKTELLYDKWAASVAVFLPVSVTTDSGTYIITEAQK